MKKHLTHALLILSVIAAALCIMPQAQDVQAATPKISRTKVTLIKGKQLKLKVTGTKKKPKWSSNKKKVATVTNKGVVKAKSKGTARITAKVGKKKLVCLVAVEAPKLNKTRLTLDVAKTSTLKVIGTKGKVKWYTSDRNVAAVSSKGVVRGIGAGSCWVYAKVNGGIFLCMVNVENTAPQQPNPTIIPIIPNTPTSTPVPTNKLIYQDDNVKIQYCGIKSNYMGYQLDLIVENLSSRTLTVQARETSINGFMVDPICSIEVAPGKKAQDGITIYGDDASRTPMNAVRDVETKFYVFDWEDMDFSYETQNVVIQ